MTLTFEYLKTGIDMISIFNRIERDICHGMPMDRVMEWIKCAAKLAVPQDMEWNDDAGGRVSVVEIRAALMDHCKRWARYVVQYAPEQNRGYAVSAKVEQLRIRV